MGIDDERSSMEKGGEYERVFKRFDENGDGKISAAELRQCVATLGVELTEADAEEAVAAMDADGDGELGMKDFLKLMEGGEEEEKAKDLREAFRMYEEMGGSGCITAKSLRRTLRRLGEKKSIEECRLMISCFDINGDGVLSFEEFRAMMS
ncbi:putative calcium-binding protein CML19 [Diospyros lotus]|uniref:putative calcium-binding protein CML19 n=1 Tax=Diospyros lotus TaxID=55363 RepID=UPI00224D2332|nr:putative calcium-binding protein CML19 [Diospyros lotus]